MTGPAEASAKPNRRYAARVEKGENAWRREWSGFMSGVSLKDLRKGGGVALPKAADLCTGDSGGGCTFSYLFTSAADRKAERLARRQEEAERRRQREQQSRHSDDPLAQLSKHERSLLEAKQRGLNVEGMTRKEVRQFLQLTVSKEQQEAEQRLREEGKEFKPHKLMDERLQWYQQGPHPIDLIAEKLVMRKATKKGKQLGLRYNYLLPHPSWMARRERRRREASSVSVGKRILFDDEGNAMDVFGRRLDPVGVFLRPSRFGDTSGAEEGKSHEQGSTSIPAHQKQQRLESGVLSPSTLGAAAVLADSRDVGRSLVRAVVRDRSIAIAIKNANLTTSYISDSLVKGPSIGLEGVEGADEKADDLSGAFPKRSRTDVGVRPKVVPHKRSRCATFDP